MKVALLISTYNWPQALDLVLKSAICQSHLPDEIVVADDGSNNATKTVIESYKKKSSIPIKHIWQEDKGFRKAAILNKAVAQSSGAYIIQADGDCILHRDFVKDHLSFADNSQFLFGSRVNIQKHLLPQLFERKKIQFTMFSKGIKKRTRALRIPVFAWFYKSSSVFSGKFRGCNFSFNRQDFIKVNGYNEAFEGWGKEDSELAIRLLNSGCKGRRLRYKGVVFHIWHAVKSKDRLQHNEELQTLVQNQKTAYCENGVSKYLDA